MPIAWFQLSLRRTYRPLLASAVYIVLFLAFDEFASAFAIDSIVSLWYPSAGLSLALIFGFGPVCAPALMIANLFSLSWHHQLGLDWSGSLLLVVPSAQWLTPAQLPRPTAPVLAGQGDE